MISRPRCAVLLALLVVLGIASKVYTGPGAGWIAAHAGGFVYVLFWIFLVLFFAPNAPVGIVAATVFAVTSVLEVLQLWSPPALESVRSTFIGHALIGSTFSWLDFLYYGLAAVAAPFLARLARHLVKSR